MPKCCNITRLLTRMRKLEQWCWWERQREGERAYSEKRLTNHLTNRVWAAVLWASHLQPAPPPVSGSYKVWGEGRGGGKEESSSSELIRQGGSVGPSIQRHCSNLQHPLSNSASNSECSPGSSPVKTGETWLLIFLSAPSLPPPLPFDLLKEHLLCSHAWVLGWGECVICTVHLHIFFVCVYFSVFE